jgi:type I restriction enzyme S subunit
MSKITLKEVSELITKGTTPSSVGCEFVEEGINFIKSESISDSKHLNNQIYEHIDEVTDDKLKRSRLKEGDLLFSIAGAYLGKIGIVQNTDVPANTNQAVGIVRLKKELVDIDYVYYFFSQTHINSYINKLSSQSSQPNLNLDLLGKLEFELLDIATQKQIAAVLSSLDSKIELNNRINAELEAMAKTLYDYWFVQFEFPAEASAKVGNKSIAGKSYKTSGGKMVWNEELKREVPEGWRAKVLSDFCNKIGDGIHGTPEYVDSSDYSFINGNNLKNGFIEIDADTKNVTAKEYEKYFIDLNDGTILLSINGTLGNLAVYTGEKVMLGKSAAYINCEGKKRPFCYQYLRLEHIQKKIWNIATGSTIKNLSLESIKNLLVPFPGDDLVERYYELAKPLDDKRENIFKENQKLSELRDWLLPMLMNGQVRV